MNAVAIAKSLRRLRPGAAFLIEEDSLDGIHWCDEEQSCPSRAEILAELQSMAQERKATAYKRTRRRAYREAGFTVERLMEALWEAEVEGRRELLEEIQVARLAIKKRIPKGGA